MPAWDAASLGAIRDVAPESLEDGEIRALTINAWRLEAEVRVGALAEAVRELGASMGEGRDARPELIAIQEVQSPDALRAIERELAGEGGYFAACECSIRSDGSIREANVAIVRPPLVATSHECIPLGAVFPDHERCAVLVRAVEARGERVDFVSVHLAWHPSNASMARRLRRELASRGALGPRTIVGGDLNTWPGSDAYGALAAPPLGDAVPGGAPTHFAGGRLDYVLAGAAFDVVRPLDRRRSHDLVAPGDTFFPPAACERSGPPGCPVSDHLPEAVVLRAR
jgi:endonuclease/exonuclease/phosphatase family metal-dependent hydrolase